MELYKCNTTDFKAAVCHTNYKNYLKIYLDVQ